MDKLISKLILNKLAVRCEFTKFNHANYFANYFLSMFLTPKHLKLFAGGGLIGAFVNNPLEGYRTLVPIKTTKIPPNQKIQNRAGREKEKHEKRKTVKERASA